MTGSDIAFIRYGVAGLVMLPWLARNRPGTLAGVGWRRGIILAALAGPLFVLTGVGGYRFAPLAHGAILQPAALTIGGTLLAAVVLKERPTVARVVGIGVILGGLAAIAGPAALTANRLTPVGDLMFMLAGLMWAVFAILTKRWSLAALPATAAVSVISAAAFVPAYLALVGLDRIAGTGPGMVFAQFMVQGVLSGVVAVFAFAKAVELLGAARAAVFPALVPAVAIALGVPVTGEIPTTVQLVGLALVSIGSLFAVGVLKTPRIMARAVQGQ